MRTSVVKKGVAVPACWALAGYWGVGCFTFWLRDLVGWWGWGLWLCTKLLGVFNAGSQRC